MALLFLSKMDDPIAWREELQSRIPDLDFRIWPDTGDEADIDIALAWRPPPGELKRFPNLRAIISLGAGVDHILSDPESPVNVPLARIVDPMLTFAMTEYVLLAVLRHHRRFDCYERDQRDKRWQFEPPPDAHQRTVGVMGLGVLGGDAARVLTAHGFKVRGWSRTPKEIPSVECFFGKDQLKDFLSECEILVCLLPLTQTTQDIVNGEVLNSLPEGSYFINPSRGGLVDERDLLKVLESGNLAGATLDVFQSEPLPQDNPLWTQHNVLVTPHIASLPYPYSSAPQVVENIQRVHNGQSLLNQVDRSVGY
ncbi:MAG: glyoxylate/hydroxypyruvate reductase A [Gammaproteobacteria bacterium]|nr:glyoxylate/hydroxypyruvate reductase A [Gammaproteobacteria bacterium]